MKKYLIGGVIVAALALYIVFGNGNSSSIAPSANEPTASANPVPTSSPSVAPTTPPQKTTPATTGEYKNGTYTGKVADAFYGNLQVAAVITGGKLTDVKFLAYPNDRGESVQINSRSNPILKQEAIKAQGAQVDIVSGATQSSEAFQESLASALAQAKS